MVNSGEEASSDSEIVQYMVEGTDMKLVVINRAGKILAERHVWWNGSGLVVTVPSDREPPR